jgi:hypothetical protein
MFGPKDQTEEIINLIWNPDVYYLVTAGKSAPSKKELKELASHYRVTLPNEYLAHACGYWGGLYLEVREQFWPRHKAGDVGPFWSFSTVCSFTPTVRKRPSGCSSERLRPNFKLSVIGSFRF